jgi:methyl-accepting chemotaxis protein
MKTPMRFIINSDRILHILHMSAIVGCAINLFMKFSIVAIIPMVAVTITYAMFLHYCKRQGTLSISHSGPEVQNQETTISAEAAEVDAIQHVTSAVKSKVSVFPILTEQLKAVIKQTDSAAEGLITAFMGINRQAKKQLKSVQELFGNISEQSGVSTLSETQQELQEIQSNFASMVTFFDRSIEMISDVVSQLSRVDQFALKIKKIGQMTNILALNAAIEAAHTGDAGSGFKVIASEINTLSKDSNSSIIEIAEITEKLTSNVGKIKQELESVHQDTMNIGKRTDKLFSLAMGKIGETLQDAAAKMNTIAGDAAVLNKDISNVVVSIQFQDITRQRIEHVITPLETLQKEISEIIGRVESGETCLTQSPLSSTDSSLMEHYTMESEREVLRNLKNGKS